MISSTHLHAMAVHFPIALLLLGFISEIIALVYKKDFFSKAAFFLLLTGTVGTIAAYLSGNAAGEGMEDGTLAQAMHLHEQAATVTLWLAILTSTFYLVVYLFQYQNRWIRIISILLFAVLAGAVVRTGYLGGQLVYKHGAGVQLTLPDFSAPGIEKGN